MSLISPEVVDDIVSSATKKTSSSGRFAQFGGGSRAGAGGGFSLHGAPRTGGQDPGAGIVQKVAGAGMGQGAKPAKPLPPALTGGTVTNTAQTNPDLQYVIDQSRKRFEGDGGAGTAIDLMTTRMRDAAEGERRAAMGRRASRGVIGSGVDDYDERGISDRLSRNMISGASDIALGREKEKDSILSNIAGVGATKAGIAGADRDRALQQWQTVEQNRMQQEQAQLSQLNAIINLLSATQAA
jgi:hypothetical protein